MRRTPGRRRYRHRGAAGGSRPAFAAGAGASSVLRAYACSILIVPNGRSEIKSSEALSPGPEIPFVEVHHRAIPTTLPVGETQAFVESAGGHVPLTGAKVHAVGPTAPGLLDRLLHQGSPEPLPASMGDNVELRQVALKPCTPDRRAEPEHCQAVRPLASEQHHALARAKEHSNAVGQRGWLRRGLIKLAIEIVQKLTDGLSVFDVRTTDDAFVQCRLVLAWST